MLEVPHALDATLFGTLVDGWQVPLVHAGPTGEDQGKDGKYPILPPDFHAEGPAGCLRTISKTEGAEGVARRKGEGASWSTRARVESSWR